jgi:hypothetical protein
LQLKEMKDSDIESLMKTRNKNMYIPGMTEEVKFDDT